MFVEGDKVGGLRKAGNGAGLVVCGYLEGSSQFGAGLSHPEREVARLRRTIGPTWRGVAGLPFRRSLGRVVAGL